jgi:lipoprotein signal peptidase
MAGKRIFAVLVPLLAVAFDRFLKWYSFAALPGEGAVLFNGLEYKMFLNSGLVFSLLNNLAALLATLVAAALLALWLASKISADRSWLFRPTNLFSVLLVSAGGASNLFDRIAYGGVVDYLILFSRSAVNVADIMILAGVLLLILKPDSKGGLSASAE